MKKGFTLLEMIFVLSVISLIFMLTIPNIQKSLNILHVKGCEAQLKIVDAAILQYELEFQSEPYSIDDLVSESYITENQTKCQDNRSIDINDGQAYAN
ncbi:MAG: competence type IV pilus major pilin ComGC [Erysipelotrichaceae bacterium]|jgi:competence protein ComGC